MLATSCSQIICKIGMGTGTSAWLLAMPPIAGWVTSFPLEGWAVAARNHELTFSRYTWWARCQLQFLCCKGNQKRPPAGLTAQCHYMHTALGSCTWPRASLGGTSCVLSAVVDEAPHGFSFSCEVFQFSWELISCPSRITVFTKIH